MVLIKCPSCGTMVLLEGAATDCSGCGARLEADSDSPVMKLNTNRFIENGRLRGRWLVLVIAAWIAVSTVAFLLLY